MDETSLNRIKTLHPKVKGEVLELFTEASSKVNTDNSFLRLAYTLRTAAEQHAIFIQKPKVTNADAWQSIHNYGLAFDIVFIKDGKGSWEVDEDWMLVVAIFKNRGWSWGGDWKRFKDRPHFEKTFGHTWRSLNKLRLAGKIDSEGYVIVD